MFQRLQPPVVELAVLWKDLKIGVTSFLPYVSEGKQHLEPHNTNTPTRVPNTTLQQTSSPDITTVSNTLYNRTSWTTQHALSSDHLPIITTINIRHDYNKPTDFHQLQESWLDTIHGRHRDRFHSDHHTHQHTHCQQNFHKHHTDGRQAQHTKGQDA